MQFECRGTIANANVAVVQLDGQPLLPWVDVILSEDAKAPVIIDRLKNPLVARRPQAFQIESRVRTTNPRRTVDIEFETQARRTIDADAVAQLGDVCISQHAARSI